MKVAVVLSGCGVFDGSEIHESVITILELCRNGAEIEFLAPDINQRRVVNHLTSEETSEKRNVMVESARIARGKISPLEKAKATDYDAIIFPGGFGAALNLCDYGAKGSNCTVNPAVEKFIVEGFENGIPLGFICIAPALAARVLGRKATNLKVTIGNDPEVAEDIRKMGATHVECKVDDCVVDTDNKVVTTPAYMLAQNIAEAAAGISKLVTEILKMAKK